MSGGSYQYFYLRLQQYISDVEIDEDTHEVRDNSPERVKLLKVLEDIVPLMKDIEWTDSGDTCGEEETENIRKFLDKYGVR